MRKILIPFFLVCFAGVCFAQNPPEKFPTKSNLAQYDIDNSLKTALNLYYLDNYTYPKTEQGLQALLTKPEIKPIPVHWNGPYFERKPIDPWGNPYRYGFPSKLNTGAPFIYDLWSNGPDGVESDDDISNVQWVKSELNYKAQNKLDKDSKEKVVKIFNEIPKKFPYFQISSIQVGDDWKFSVAGVGMYPSFLPKLTQGLENSAIFENVDANIGRSIKLGNRDACNFEVNGGITDKVLAMDNDRILSLIVSALEEDNVFKENQKHYEEAISYEAEGKYVFAIPAYAWFISGLYPESDQFKATQEKINQLKNKEQEQQEANKWIKSQDATSAMTNSNVIEGLNKKISLEVEDVALADVLKFLSIKGGFKMESLMPIEGRVKVKVLDQPIVEVLNTVLKDHDFAFQVESNIVYVMTKSIFKERYGKDFNNDVVTKFKTEGH